MKRTMIIVAGIIAVLVGMGFVMPAIAQWRHEGAMTTSSVLLGLLGFVLTLGGMGTAARGVAKHS